MTTMEEANEFFESAAAREDMRSTYREAIPQGAQLLDHAIRHIRRVHMSRAWTLSAGDEQAIAVLQNLLDNVYVHR